MDVVDLNNINAPIIPESNKIGKNYKKEITMFSPSEFEAFIFEWIKFCKYKDQKVGQMFKGGLSFAMGGMLVGSGVWNIGKGIPNTINPILRAAAKTTATFIPNMLIDNIFNSF